MNGIIAFNEILQAKGCARARTTKNVAITLVVVEWDKKTVGLGSQSGSKMRAEMCRCVSYTDKTTHVCMIKRLSLYS